LHRTWGMWRSILTCAILLLASDAAAGPLAARRAPGPGPQDRAGRRSLQRVRGLDGQADLLIDPGRSLEGVPLRKAEAGGRSSPGRLSAIEKARLDARRIGLASRLTPEARLDRLVAIVLHRMPLAPEAMARYERVSEAQVRRWGGARLSELTLRRAGICRERAFLLKALLDELSIPARVRYGVLYDSASRYIGGHVWVEATLGGRRVLLDLSRSRPIQPKRTVLIEEEMPDGPSRQVRAARTSEFIYVPTSDLTVSSVRDPS
jgi:hypothetical protein